MGHQQEPVRRLHGYPHYQWIQVRAGRLRLTLDAGSSVARPGDGLFLEPDQFHSYEAQGPAKTVVDWMAFDGSGVPQALAGSPLVKSGIFRMTSTEGVDLVLSQAWSEASRSSFSSSRLSVFVYGLIMALAEGAVGTGGMSVAAGMGRLEPVLTALALQPARPWDVGTLGALVGVTPQHLGRLFRRALGSTPQEYLIRLRLNRALQLLLERPDLRIHEIGSAVGYSDTNYFIRLFPNREGRTPGHFRALHGF
jgi:AraC-like DNA-binding protein